MGSAVKMKQLLAFPVSRIYSSSHAALKCIADAIDTSHWDSTT